MVAMKLLVLTLCLLPLAGCLDTDPEPATSFVIELQNTGNHSHSPTLKITGPDGVVFNQKVSVPAEGSFERTWDMPEGNYRADVFYKFSKSSGGSSVDWSGSKAHTWHDYDCPPDAIRLVFTHTINFGNGQNNFSTGTSTGYCE
jgi:hypothetical protein